MQHQSQKQRRQENQRRWRLHAGIVGILHKRSPSAFTLISRPNGSPSGTADSMAFAATTQGRERSAIRQQQRTG